jgi:two-component system, OmpR family, alkaline phosphatase synthesis response regulator PhoP
MAQRVLIVEDEQHLAEGLRFNLEAEGYAAQIVETGELALERLLDPATRYDLVVLDVMLPGMDGFAVVSELRQQRQYLPVLILTARGRPEDVLKGFAAGADDYLPKPSELAILLARIGSLLRRSSWTRPPRPDRYTFNGRAIDFDTLELTVGERVLKLTLMEANLLRYLIAHEGKAVSRKAMLENVWELHEDTDTRAIDNFVVRLRRYIETEPARPQHLLTVRGVGYRFVANPSTAAGAAS